MPAYAKYNSNSLSNERARILTQDAISLLDHTANFTTEKYNVIIWDFPSPGDEADQDCTGLYTRENIQKALKCLTENGVFVSQVSLPIAILGSLAKELMSQGFFVWQYDVMYDTKGNHDAFIVASKKKLWQQREVPEFCRFASPEKIKAGFSAATEIVEADFDYYLQFLHQEDLD
jgi:predicted membrane-bound spermidine synthase